MRLSGSLMLVAVVLVLCIGVVVVSTHVEPGTVVSGAAQAVSHTSGTPMLGTDGHSFLDGLMSFARCLADAGDNASAGLSCW